MQRDDFLWVEKYRPSKVSECVLPSDLQEPFSEYVEQGKQEKDKNRKAKKKE